MLVGEELAPDDFLGSPPERPELVDGEGLLPAPQPFPPVDDRSSVADEDQDPHDEEERRTEDDEHQRQRDVEGPLDDRRGRQERLHESETNESLKRHDKKPLIKEIRLPATLTTATETLTRVPGDQDRRDCTSSAGERPENAVRQRVRNEDLGPKQ